MDQASKKILSLILIGLSLSCGSIAKASARDRTPVKPKHSFISGHWVVKLKQNSYFNRRPFQFASPTVSGDQVFVGVHREIFYGVDAKKGKKIWQFRAQGPIHAAAAVSDDAVYFADTKGTVYALEKKSGKPIWLSKVDGPVLSKPFIAGDKLYIVTLTKELSCFDRKEGKLLWQENSSVRDSGFTIQGSADPIAVGPFLLVGYSDGSLVAHRLENGKVGWSKQLGDSFEEFHDVDSTPFIAQDEKNTTVYVSSADGKLFAFNPQNGAVVWEAPIGGVNDAVVADSFLYVTAGGVVYCLQAKNGQTLWEQDLQLPEISSPAVYKDWIVVAATKGRAYFLDRKNGDILYSWYVRGGSYSDPVVDGNQVFILSNAARLYSFQFR